MHVSVYWHWNSLVSASEKSGFMKFGFLFHIQQMTNNDPSNVVWVWQMKKHSFFKLQCELGIDNSRSRTSKRPFGFVITWNHEFVTVHLETISLHVGFSTVNLSVVFFNPGKHLSSHFPFCPGKVSEFCFSHSRYDITTVSKALGKIWGNQTSAKEYD